MRTSKKTLEEYVKGREPNFVSTVEGVGAVRVYGVLELEKLVKRLIKSKYFAG